MCSSLSEEFLQKQLQRSNGGPRFPICPHPGNATCWHTHSVWSICDPIIIYKTDRFIRTDQGSPFIADPSAKLLCPQLGPNNPTSCWMKPSDPIPKPFFPPLHKEEKEENTKTGQDTVDQAPTTDSTDSELDPTIQSAFDPQSQPADYTAQEGTTGLPGILPAANPQSPAQPDTFQQASSSVPETQATTSQPNEMAFNDFQPGDLSSMFTETG